MLTAKAETIINATNGARRRLSQGRYWAMLLVVALLCFLSGPFHTLELLPNGLRFVYWTLITLSTGVLGIWTFELTKQLADGRLFQLAAIAVIFGLSVAIIVTSLCRAFMGPIGEYPGAPTLFVQSFPIAVVIFLFFVFLDRFRTSAGATEATERPALFRQLSKHGDAQHILALSAHDHYVEVITERGSELCLMRLNDAIRDAAPTEGVLIHRSHWVALAAIEDTDLQGNTPSVRLKQGHVFRVSRARLKDLRAKLGLID